MRLTEPLFTIFAKEISGRDIILILAGLFLLCKSTLEIHGNLEGDDIHSSQNTQQKSATFFSVVIQMMVLDIIFSLDSVITAIGLAKHLAVMVAVIVIAMIFMILLAGKLSDFVEGHPTIKILALSFLLMIGFALVGEGLDLHIPKGYIYFAMAFSTFVEVSKLKVRRRQKAPLKLRHPRADKIRHAS